MRIVEYVAVPEVEPPFAIAAEPVYQHGANPGDYEFQGINVGRLFPDGSAVVADRENSEVVVLSPDGTTHRVIARRGQGPGDVTYPYSMFVLGQDSVLVPDNRLSRLTLFVGDSVARIASLPRSSSLGVAGIGSSMCAPAPPFPTIIPFSPKQNSRLGQCPSGFFADSGAKQPRHHGDLVTPSTGRG